MEINNVQKVLAVCKCNKLSNKVRYDMQKEKQPCNKCRTCENRNPKTNFCEVKQKDCGTIDTEFTKCNDYLMNSKLSMF